MKFPSEGKKKKVEKKRKLKIYKWIFICQGRTKELSSCLNMSKSLHTGSLPRDSACLNRHILGGKKTLCTGRHKLHLSCFMWEKNTIHVFRADLPVMLISISLLKSMDSHWISAATCVTAHIFCKAPQVCYQIRTWSISPLKTSMGDRDVLMWFKKERQEQQREACLQRAIHEKTYKLLALHKPISHNRHKVIQN